MLILIYGYYSYFIPKSVVLLFLWKQNTNKDQIFFKRSG